MRDWITDGSRQVVERQLLVPVVVEPMHEPPLIPSTSPVFPHHQSLPYIAIDRAKLLRRIPVAKCIPPASQEFAQPLEQFSPLALPTMNNLPNPLPCFDHRLLIRPPVEV